MTGSHEVRGSNPLFSTINDEAGAFAPAFLLCDDAASELNATSTSSEFGLTAGEKVRMSEETSNPVEAFGLRVAHVGINASSPEEAMEIASLFEALMGLAPVKTPVSVFADTLVEVMSGCGRGEKGHIGFGVNDIPAAEKWFAARGFEINEDSRALNPDGTTKLVYFKREIAGFAIHLCQN